MIGARLLAPSKDADAPSPVLTPGQQAAEAWGLYLARTAGYDGEVYLDRERREWRRLKGRLAALRIDDAERLMPARDHLHG